MLIKERLPNGIRVVGQVMAQVRSCAVGIWVGTGSIHERADESGVSHFIEHMLFKGTTKRSAQDIAAQMDGIGGNINAFTSKECTCYYVKVLDEHISLAVDILADILQNSRLDPDDIAKEQGVVCEEILMLQDSPEDLAHEMAAELYYQEDSLARPILGTEKSVRAFTRESLARYMDRRYIAPRVVISVAGNFQPAMLMDIIREKFGGLRAGTDAPAPDNRAPGGRRYLSVEKDIEQIHICMALPGTAMDTPAQYPLFVLSNILGGSMSSRLFQKIREERGLAYSIYSYPSCYRSAGAFALYAGTGEQQAPEVVELMLKEMDILRKQGVTQAEFIRGRDQLKGSYLLGQEGTSSRMNALGKTALLLDRDYSEEETLRRIEAVTLSDVQALLPAVLDEANLSAVCVGRTGKQAQKICALLGV